MDVTKTPYSKSCNKTIKEFYDDFDLLPSEYKAILQESPTMPTHEDLKLIWEMVAEEQPSIQDIINRVKCIPKPPPAREMTAREKREAKRAENRQRRLNQQNGARVACYGYRRIGSDNPNLSGSLKTFVSEREAAAAIAKRKQNNSLKFVGNNLVERVFLGYKPKERYTGGEKPDKKVVKDHISWAMHNAGGKV